MKVKTYQASHAIHDWKHMVWYKLPILSMQGQNHEDFDTFAQPSANFDDDLTSCCAKKEPKKKSTKE